MKKEYFKNDWIDDYRRLNQALLAELIQLNDYNFLMKRISEFPFHLFPHKDNRFWDCIFMSMYHSSVVNIYKISFDDDKEALSLNKFKNKILKNLENENKKELIKQKLKNLNFNVKIEAYRNDLRDERNCRLAHFKQKENSQPIDEDIRRKKDIVINLNKIIKLINQYFEILCFGEIKINLSEYSNGLLGQLNDTQDNRIDIEQLLDYVAEKSEILNMPENNIEIWKMKKIGMKQEDIKIINLYRIKFGLPEA